MITWRRFRKRPVDIEAFAWGGRFEPPVINEIESDDPGFHERPCEECTMPLGSHGLVLTREQPVRACPTDMIIRGIRGELYPCKRDIFDEIYEELKTYPQWQDVERKRA